jgi:sporulation protein YlmC with PRC-barrel domain
MTRFYPVLASMTLISSLAVASLAIMPAAAQGTQQVVTTIDITAIARGYRSTKITGSAVVNEKGETVGKIDDLIITRDQRALFAIVSVGGYLGMGNKLIAVRYEELKPTSDDKGFVLAGATKEGLKALQEFIYAH